MATATGLLAVWMQIPADQEEDLNQWYRQEHLPERIGIQGFLTALRYVSLRGEPKYMALYDLETPQVLYSESYRELRGNSTEWTRRIGRALEKNIRNEYELLASAGAQPSVPAPYIVLTRFGGGEGSEQWMTERLLPVIASTPGVLRARAYRAVVGTPAYLAYYELAEDGVYGAEAWQQSERESGFEQVLAKLTDFAVNYGRFIEAAQKLGAGK